MTMPNPHGPERQQQVSQPFGESFRPPQSDETLWNELQQTVHPPYFDEELVISRLTSPSRVFRRYPEAQEIVEETLVSTDDGSILATADLLHEVVELSQPAAAPPVARLLSFLNTAHSIAGIKNRVVGEEAPNDRANAIVNMVGMKLAAHVPDEQVTEYLYSAQFLLARIKDMVQGRAQPYAPRLFYESKLEQLISSLTSREYINRYAKLMPGHDEKAPTQKEIEADSEAVKEVFTEIRESQQYGIKLGYKAHPQGGSLVFSRPHDSKLQPTIKELQNVHPLMLKSHVPATVIHSYRKSFKTLKPELISLDENLFAFSYENLGPVSTMHLGEDGELYGDRFCQISVRDSFVRAHKYGAYRKLQAEVIAGYFDMTQPAEIVNTINRTIASKVGANTSRGTENPMDVMHDLVVPRLRFIKQNAALMIESAADEELEAVESRPLRFHDVTWHRRRLPNGWSASPEALKLAKEAGIKLEDNETFVQDHHRGSKEIGEVVGHHYLQRQH